MPTTNEKDQLAGPTRPLGAPDIPQFHLPAGESKGTYAPRIYGAALIQFADGRRKIGETRRVAFLLPLEAGTRTVDWEGATPTEVMPEQLLKDAPKRAHYLPLPAASMQVKTFTRWARAFDRWLARTQRFTVTPKSDTADEVTIGPKRGGVAVQLVGIVWDLS